MRRVFRLLCTLLAAAVLVTVLPVSVRADDDFLLTVVENSFVESVAESDRAAYINGIIYVPYRRIDGLNGVRVYYNVSLQQLFVYSLDLRMTFDLANSQTYDSNGEFYPPLAVRRAGTIFLPIQLVCAQFDLHFSYTSAGTLYPAPIIRLCGSRPTTSNGTLYSANRDLIDDIYERYRALTAPSAGDEPGSSTPTTPTVPKPVPEPEPATLTYLTFSGMPGDETPAILDALESAGCPGAFFLPAEEADALPADLLRQIYARGGTLGLLLREPGDEPVTLLERANRRLSAVLHVKTRLVLVENGVDSLTDEQREALIGAGFRLWDCGVAPTLSDAPTLLRTAKRLLGRADRAAVVRLDNSAAVREALPELCRWMAGNNCSPLAVTEWNAPVNRANEVR